MLKDGFLKVGENESFKTIAEIFNRVFELRKKDGSEYVLIRKVVKNVNTGKMAWFPNLAKDNKGIWQPVKKKDWINIPSPKEDAITQISLKKGGKKVKRNPIIQPNDDVAVFVRKKKYGYNLCFYGIFHLKEIKETGITEWRRKNTILKCKGWREPK
jgi:hypothetical protein